MRMPLSMGPWLTGTLTVLAVVMGIEEWETSVLIYIRLTRTPFCFTKK